MEGRSHSIWISFSYRYPLGHSCRCPCVCGTCHPQCTGCRVQLSHNLRGSLWSWDNLRQSREPEDHQNMQVGCPSTVANQKVNQRNLGTKICLLNWDGSQMSCFQYPWKFRCSSAGWWWEDHTAVPWKRPSQSQRRKQASQPHMSQNYCMGLEN